jgi:DNA-binding response OmpR family regulator
MLIAGAKSIQMIEGRRALVVDDDQKVLAMLSRWLRDAGWDVASASTLAEARARIDEDPPDALVVDVRLREFNGIQLAVRARATSPGMRIVVVSGFDDPVLRREAMACDANFLTKPLTRGDLLAAVTPSAGEEFRH